MSLLRVLHCRQGDRVWGPERQILQLAEHLPELGIEMEIVLLRRWGLDPEPHPLTKQARALGCVVHEISARPQDTLRVVRFLCRRLAGCDLLHTHEFKSDLLGWPAARRVGRPWIATDHHLAVDESRLLRLFATLDRHALKRADAVIVPSYSQAQRLHGVVPPERLHVIYHGIDAAAFARGADHARPQVRRQYGVADDEPVVAVFGRLEPVKGHADLLEAARHMLQVRPDLHFWIVGEGSLAQALQQQAQALGIADAVRFLGYQRNVAPLMAASDLIVLPSHHESFGIVLIEAMALGKPIIASAAGGIPEVVRDGEQGLLVAPGQPQELSIRALALLSDPVQAAALGEAGRRHVETLFTVQSMVERVAALYRQVVAESQAASMTARQRSSSRLYPLSRS